MCVILTSYCPRSSADGLLHCHSLDRDAVDDEFQRSAGIARGDDRFSREKRLERDVAVVFVVGRKRDGEGAGIEIDELLVVDAAREAHAIGDARFRGGGL